MLLTISLTLIGSIFFIIIFSFTLLTGSYTQFEEQLVKQDVENGLKVLSSEEDRVKSLNGDWSRWDETYLFIQDKNDEYISKNLNYESIENLGIDFLIFLRTDHSVKDTICINATSKALEPLPEAFLSRILTIPGFFSYESISDTKSGIVLLPDYPAIVVSGPIITSTYQGPVAGYLVMGIYLDNDKIHELSEMSGLFISVTSENQTPQKNSRLLYSGRIFHSKITSSPLPDDMIQGSTLVSTINSDGYLRFGVTTVRDILRQGKETIATFVLSLITLGFVVIVVSLITIDRLVLNRLNQIISTIKNRSLGKPENTILLPGDDEFSELGRVIHPVFMELNRSNEQLEDHIRRLVESEKKYRELADFLPEYIFECDIQGNVHFLNRIGQEISGYNSNDLDKGLDILGLIDPGDHPAFKLALLTIHEGNSVSGHEYTGRKKSGDTFPMVFYAAPICTDGVITGFRGFAIDISERKRSEYLLRKLAGIVEHTNTGIVTGTGDCVDYVNPAYSLMHGREIGEFIGKDPFVSVIERRDKYFYHYLQVALQSVHSTFELEHTKKDGTIFPAMHELTVLSGKRVEDSTWVMNVQDITDHRLAWKALMESEALRESSRQLRDVISRLPDATFVVDKDGWVIFWNHAMESLTNIHQGDIIGRGRYEYSVPFFGERRPMLLNMILEKEKDFSVYYTHVAEAGGSYCTEESFPGMEKGEKFFSTVASPLYDSKGGIIGAIQSMRDITPRIMAEKALMKTNEKLNLLSSITRHDIRNRITVLIGLLPMLQQLSHDPEVDEMVGMIGNAVRSIHDQIEFTRLYQDLGIQTPIWSSVRHMVEKASEGGIPDQVKISIYLEEIYVYADPLLERAFYNLVDNALRHGGIGLSDIRFSWRIMDDSLCILCEDDGIGIPGDLKEKIFERGYGSNTGLGLFLVREILSITGLTIRETGESGKGARFEIRVPYGAYSLRMKNGDRV